MSVPQSSCGHEPLIAALMAQVEVLTARVAELEARLGKNSQNSSKPPSTDGFVKPPPRSLRKKSGRRPGKQPGDAGARLEPAARPDEVREHPPACCGCCGADLAEAPVVGHRVRQVFDVPPVQVRVTEHRVQARRCRCGEVTEAEFPPEALAPTCYGPGVKALAVYLLGRQHLPVDRTRQTLADLLGVEVSTGWLADLMPAARGRLAEFCEAVRAHLRGAPVAHFDETGGRVEAKLRWIHVAATDHYTL